jgi:hypothetical protein
MTGNLRTYDKNVDIQKVPLFKMEKIATEKQDELAFFLIGTAWYRNTFTA